MANLGYKPAAALAGVALCSGLLTSPALARGDAIYHHRPASELPVLRLYHRQPYWRGLAECAGIHGVLMDRFQAAGQVQAADVSRRSAILMLQKANARLRLDRVLDEREALAVSSPAVEAGRASGEALLQPRRAGQAFSPEQVALAMCGQLADRDAEFSRAGR